MLLVSDHPRSIMLGPDKQKVSCHVTQKIYIQKPSSPCHLYSFRASSIKHNHLLFTSDSNISCTYSFFVESIGTDSWDSVIEKGWMSKFFNSPGMLLGVGNNEHLRPTRIRTHQTCISSSQFDVTPGTACTACPSNPLPSFPVLHQHSAHLA